ncbi:MAG: hypothetical protein NTX15_06870 [Candidatus Kapabacteria bacterium]|nr:hypothetical protein [Candidatus Kapabacteria bacterium]
MLRLLFVVWVIASVQLYAQRELIPLAVDAAAGAGFHSGVGTFGSVPGIPSPGNTGWWFDLGADIPLAEHLRIGGRLGAYHTSAVYAASERVPIATEQGNVFLATLQHTIAINATLMMIEPRVRYEPLSWLALEVGVPLSIELSSKYKQTQRFSDPNGLPFVDGNTEQVTGQGAIPNVATIIPGIEVHAEGILPLNTQGDLLLVPRLGYSRMLTSLNTNGAFQTQSINVGIGVRYLFGTKELATVEVPKTNERTVVILRDTTVDLSAQVREPITRLVTSGSDSSVIDGVLRVTIRERYATLLPKPPSVLRGSLRLAFMHDDGSVSDDARLYAQRVRVERTVPIMPVVMFDDTSSAIPSRYVQISSVEANTWKDQSALLDANTHWQYNILNIIGFRLKVNPNSTCTLLAYDDGTDAGMELVSRRCAAVQQYVSKTFTIPLRRIAVEVKRGQASQPPWVMIVDPTRVLAKPLAASSVQNETRLPRVRVMPDIVSEAGIDKWSVTMFQSGKSVRSFSDTGAVPSSILWNMNDNLETDAVLAQPILVELRLEDKEGASTKSEPGRVVVRSQSVTDVSGIPSTRVEILRVLPPDFLATPDAELFSGTLPFTHVEFYPASANDEAEYLRADVPVVKKQINADVWFRRGLTSPEKELYQRAELYIKEERRP